MAGALPATSPQKRLLIYGSSEFGQIVWHLAASCGRHCAGYIDDVRTAPEVLGTMDAVHATHSPDEHAIVIAVGYRHLEARRMLFERVVALGYEVPALVHPAAIVAPSVTLGAGVVVMAGACVDVETQVGDLTVLWPGAIVSHHCVLAGNTFVSPNATICGRCIVDRDVFVGAGATITDYVRVPAATFIKANAVYSLGESRRQGLLT